MEQDGGSPVVSVMMTESETRIQLDAEEEEEEEDNGGTGVVVDDGFSPNDAH